MTDLAPAFSALLTTTNPDIPPIPPSRRPPPPRDEFLKEAYRIATLLYTLLHHLSTTRKPYLSTTASTSLTDAQRTALDSEVKSLLQQSHILITRLSQAESIRSSTASTLLQRKQNSWTSILGGRSGGVEVEEARQKVENAHREAVLWWLNDRLAKAGEEQRERQEVRLMRQVERGKSLLSAVKPGMQGVVRATDAEAGSNVEEELGEEVVQQLELENRGLVRYYEDALAQVRTAESSLMEISEMQTQLTMHLAEQNVHIENLMQDSMATEENVARGNKELKKAAERGSVARKAFFGAVGFSAFVIVWDWFI